MCLHAALKKSAFISSLARHPMSFMNASAPRCSSGSSPRSAAIASVSVTAGTCPRGQFDLGRPNPTGVAGFQIPGLVKLAALGFNRVQKGERWSGTGELDK